MDLFGHAARTRAAPPPPANERARLIERLTELTNHCPRSVANGSIQLTREWLAKQKKFVKLIGNSRADDDELQAAILEMQKYEDMT